MNGIAVVSVIIGSDDPEHAARNLSAILKPVLGVKERCITGKDELVSDFAYHIKVLHDANPLSHNMTNLVCILCFALLLSYLSM